MSASLPSPGDSSHQAVPPLGPKAALTSEQLLPPVEPPSARFILQLFVIPAVIVAAVVGVWFVVESLARRGQESPEAILAALRSSSQARFQRASELADMLRLPERYPKLKTDTVLASGLAQLLSEKVDEQSDAEAEVTMRIFLASALGEFHVGDGLPVLLKAAQRDAERDVRRRAIDAIAVLAGTMANLNPPQPLAGEELIATLVALARDQDELVRSQTAFALGVVAAGTAQPDPRLVDALVELSDDPYTDARFNAALGLARVGDERAAAALAEMFEPDSLTASLAGEKPMTEAVSEPALRAQKAFKRNTILQNGLAGIELLREQGVDAPETLRPVTEAMARFLEAIPTIQEPAPVPGELRDAISRSLAEATAGAK